jgi:hypothetical protein
MPIARIRRRSQRTRERDWWEKASIIIPFVSGVVITLIGLVATTAIQAGQLTAQFLALLASDNASQREKAVIAMRDSLPDEMCDNLLAVVAQTDTSPDVRARAIEQLGRSGSPKVGAVLGGIALDERRGSFERRAAATSALQVGVIQTAAAASADQNLFILGSTNGRASAPDSDHFTNLVIRGVDGAADENHDTFVSGSELGRYVATNIGLSNRMWRQKPMWVMRGSTEIFLSASAPDQLQKRYRQVVGLIVAPQSPGLPVASVQRDAVAFASAMERRTGMKLRVITNNIATKAALLGAITAIAAKVGADDLFLIYYTGAASTEPDGTVHWLLSGRGEYVTPEELNKLIELVPARNKAVLINACYAGAFAESS